MKREKGGRTLVGSRNPPQHHHHPNSPPTGVHCYRLLRIVSRLLLGPSLDVVSLLPLCVSALCAWALVD